MSICTLTKGAVARLIHSFGDRWPQCGKPCKSCWELLLCKLYRERPDLISPASPVRFSRSSIAQAHSVISEGDRVYINGKRPKFSRPLQQGGKLDLPDGFILHDEIIGARPNETFKTNKGKPYRITFPNLDTYISSMPRKVTPVWEMDSYKWVRS